MPDSDSNDITRSHVQLAHGSIIGHYRIIERIGAGGMGEVYLAEDTELNRKVALKFLPLHLCHDADCRARFKREAQAAAKLNHPNIVTIHEVSEFNGRPFFAMENVEGQTLRDFSKAKELPLSRIIELAIQVCDGLAKAHSAGIVHRDIKPSNILIDQDGRAKIVDFGLASVSGSEHLTKTGSTLGTVGYMSPEQARGEEVDARTDLFSFGVVLYELITGKSPFKAESEIATIKNIIEVVPEPLARYKNDVPNDLQRIVEKLLSKDRGHRYQHADEVSADMKRLVSAASIRQSPFRRRRRMLVPSLVILGILVVVIVLKPWRFVIKPSEEVESTLRRIAVVPFRNQTGDPSLDPLGRVIADWTTQSLLTTGIGEIVPTERLPRKTENLSMRSVIDSTGADIIVMGTFYKFGDSVQFQAQISNAEEHLLQAIEPTYSPTVKVMDGVELVRQRILGALGMLLNERLLGPDGVSPSSAKPPKYAAYQAFMEGVEAHTAMYDMASALEHYKRAYALDTTFLRPLLEAITVCANLNRTAAGDSIVQMLNLRRAQLTAQQQRGLDHISGVLFGDWAKALNAAREGVGDTHDFSWAYALGLDAYCLNRPQEAIEALESINPEEGWMRTWSYYWFILASAHHSLGNHDREMTVITRGRQLFPIALNLLDAEIQGLAATGKIDEVMKRLMEGTAIKPQAHWEIIWNAGVLMQTAGEEFRAHGHEQEAMLCFEQAVDWYRSKNLEDIIPLRFAYAQALTKSGRYDSAKSLMERLLVERPDSIDYQGWLGFIAAKQGDQVLAAKVFQWLRGLKRPYMLGSNSYYQACIAASLGEKDRAVELLKESFQQGRQFWINIHRDCAFESLWDYPPFTELMKPKG